MSHFNQNIKALTTAVIFLSAVNSYGQDGENNADRLSVEEILVTARKIAESAQDIPVAVSVLGEDELVKKSIKRLEQIQGHVPNLFLQPSGIDSLGITVAMRGQLQNDFILTLDPSIGFYVDNMYHPRTYGMRSSLIDIERLEVLRGPQGTLYGRNTTGGAINVYTKNPTDELYASLSVNAGNYGAWGITGIANIPLNDNLAARFVLQSNESDGYGEDGLGNDLGGEDRSYFRGKLRADIGDNIEAVLSGSYQKNETTGPILKLSGLLPASECSIGIPGCFGSFATAVELFGFAAFTDPSLLFSAAETLASFEDGLGHYETAGTFKQLGKFESYDIGMDISVEINDNLTFRSITSYQDFKRASNNDDAGVPFQLLTVELKTTASYFSQELQLLGRGDSYNWILGAYVGQEEGSESSRADAIVAINPNRSFRDGDIKNDSWAGFAQGTWEFLPDWHVTGGIRYSEDYRELVANNGAAGGNCNVPQGDVTGIPDNPLNGPSQCPRKFDDTFSEISWLLSLDYRFSDDALGYVKASKGYRSGGQNLRGSNTLASFASFEPEIVNEYELGLKIELFDKRLRLNVAAFYTDYEDIQRSITILSASGAPATLVTNAAKAEVNGFEAEATWRATSRLTLNASTGYTHARHKEFIDLTGDRTNEPFGVPEWMGSFSMNYNYPTDIGDAQFHLDYLWQDDVVMAPEAVIDSQVSQKAYGLVNARASLDIQSLDAEVSIFVTNLTDKEYFSSAIGIDGALGWNARTPGLPRMYGIEFIKRFGKK